MMVLLRRSGDRTINLTFDAFEDTCRIVFTIEHEENVKSENIRTDGLFCKEDGSSGVISSVMDFCELYSWKLLCKAGKDSFAVALSIPVCNYKPIRFENVTDRSFVTVIEQATSLLSDEIDSIFR